MGDEYRTASYGRVLVTRASGYGIILVFFTARLWSRVLQFEVSFLSHSLLGIKHTVVIRATL
jgi:hypothetical protein